MSPLSVAFTLATRELVTVPEPESEATVSEKPFISNVPFTIKFELSEITPDVPSFNVLPDEMVVSPVKVFAPESVKILLPE